MEKVFKGWSTVVDNLENQLHFREIYKVVKVQHIIFIQYVTMMMRGIIMGGTVA